MTGFVALLAVFVLGTALVVALGRRAAEQRWEAARTVEVTAGPTGVRRELADGRVEEVHWAEVVEVDVVIADRGPHAAAGGAVVLYATASRGVLVPLDHLEASGLLAEMTRLPGFRVEQLTSALEQRAPARTTCWTAPS